jgi:leucyl/phenylalanyl-tRNA--protein transferase
MIFQLNERPGETAFPDPGHAEREPNGLLAVGGDLHPDRLLSAYAHGIFPWYSEGQPILWWSPDPRTLLYPDRVHVSRSLRRQLRRGGLELRIDTAFNQVIAACAAPRGGQDGTWLLPEMQQAYIRLHQMGRAHAIELWRDGRLVGGLYGLALGRAFFGESMFSRIPSASRIVMVYLCEHLASLGYHFLDCQVHNPHLERMGACEIPRERFLRELEVAVREPEPPGAWRTRPLDCALLEHAQ